MAVGTVTASTASTPVVGRHLLQARAERVHADTAVVSTGPAAPRRSAAGPRSLRWVGPERVATPQAVVGARVGRQHACRRPRCSRSPPGRPAAAAGWRAARRPPPARRGRCAAMTPAWPNSASWVTSGVAAAAVCEAAARWPASDRPLITVSTGIRCPTRRAVRANLRGLPNDSTYITASLVCPSCSHQVSMSLLDTSYLSPTDANDDTPMPSLDRCAEERHPDPAGLHDQAGEPGAGWSAPNVASRPSGGRRCRSSSARPGACRTGGTSRAARDLRRPGHAVTTTSDRDAPAAARRGHLGEGGRGHRDDGQVHVLRQVLDGGQARQALQRRSVRVDRVDRPGEAAGHDVVQDLPAHRAAAPARAHDGDRRRPQQMAQAGHVRAAPPGRHRVQVVAPGGGRPRRRAAGRSARTSPSALCRCTGRPASAKTPSMADVLGQRHRP